MLSLLAVSLIKCSVLFTTAGIRKKKKGLSRLSIGWATTLLVDKGNECMPTVGIIYMYSEMLSSIYISDINYTDYLVAYQKSL